MIKVHILFTCMLRDSEAYPPISPESTDHYPICTTTAPLNNKPASLAGLIPICTGYQGDLPNIYVIHEGLELTTV